MSENSGSDTEGESKNEIRVKREEIEENDLC